MGPLGLTAPASALTTAPRETRSRGVFLRDRLNPTLSSAMPRDGALTLSDLRSPTLSFICEPCSRRGSYSVAKLMDEHGDAKLTDLLLTLADCQKARGQHPRQVQGGVRAAASVRHQRRRAS